VATIQRSEDENLNCMLILGTNTVVTGSNSSSIITYKLDRGVQDKICSYHRESVQCLAELQKPYNAFASGSLDGTIVMWSSTEFVKIMVLHSPADYVRHNVYIYSVRTLLPVGEHFLIAALGSGYIIYDLHERSKMHTDRAHSTTISSIISLYNDSRFVTASFDSIVSLWNSPAKFSINNNELSGARKKASSGQSLVGSMQVHSGAVMSMIKLSQSSFATCSDDNTVVVWKDYVQQSEWRNEEAAKSLAQHHTQKLTTTTSPVLQNTTNTTVVTSGTMTTTSSPAPAYSPAPTSSPIPASSPTPTTIAP